jgi:hypothetical protein
VEGLRQQKDQEGLLYGTPAQESLCGLAVQENFLFQNRRRGYVPLALVRTYPYQECDPYQTMAALALRLERLPA